jgi:hypothetical protein
MQQDSVSGYYTVDGAVGLIVEGPLVRVLQFVVRRCRRTA